MLNFALSSVPKGGKNDPSISPERFKTRAAHFPILRNERTGMQPATMGKDGFSFIVIRPDSESTLQ